MFLLRSTIIALLAAIASGASIEQSTTMQSIRLWSRIRISNNASDIDRLYPLLQEYIRYPERANSVKEFIYKPTNQQATYCGDAGKISFDSSAAREDARKAEDEEISNALLKLALPTEEHHKWLKHITRLRPDVMAGNSSQMMSGGWNTWDSSQDAESAHYAGSLLMLLCPQIEKLTYASNYGPAKAILQRNNYAELPIRALQYLREVRLIPSDEWWADDDRFFNRVEVTSLIRLFHRLPSFETIRTDAVDIFDNDPSFIAPGTSALKTIEFTHAEASTSDLAAIIRMAKQLEQLTIKEGGRSTNDGGHHQRFQRTMMLALTCQKDSLRSLDLDMDQHVYDDRYNHRDRYYQQAIDDDFQEARDASGFSDEQNISGDEGQSIDISKSEADTEFHPWGDEYVDRDVEVSVGPLHWSQVPELRPWNGALDLRDFSKLTKLAIGIKYILGGPEAAISTHLVDVLPPNLHSFTLYGYSKGACERYDAEVDMFISKKDELFPNLTELHGIHELIESGESVDNPDENTALLSAPLDLDDDWLDVDDEWIEVENVK